MRDLGDCEICQTSAADCVAVRGQSETLEMCVGCLDGMESEGFKPLKSWMPYVR